MIENVRRAVNRRHLCRPVRTTTCPGYRWNREYEDLRADCSWTKAKAALEFESGLLQQPAATEDILEEYEDEQYEECLETLLGLDVGVTSSVIALTAGGCVAFSSFNGGVLGNQRHESHPLIAFCANPACVPVLLGCAEAAGTGLENVECGLLG